MSDVTLGGWIIAGTTAFVLAPLVVNSVWAGARGESPGNDSAKRWLAGLYWCFCLALVAVAFFGAAIGLGSFAHWMLHAV